MGTISLLLEHFMRAFSCCTRAAEIHTSPRINRPPHAAQHVSLPQHHCISRIKDLDLFDKIFSSVQLCHITTMSNDTVQVALKHGTGLVQDKFDARDHYYQAQSAPSPLLP